MSKATEESNQQYFHSLHQLPEAGLRVGETRNETGGRVWADTGEPSVPIIIGCRYCENAYAEWLAAQIHGDGTTSVSLGLGQTVLDVEAERESLDADPDGPFLSKEAERDLRAKLHPHHCTKPVCPCGKRYELGGGGPGEYWELVEDVQAEKERARRILDDEAGLVEPRGEPGWMPLKLRTDL